MTPSQEAQRAHTPILSDVHRFMTAQQARQKLATLPVTRFRDLGSDVFFELERRYPEFKEEQELARVTPPPPAGIQTSSAANEVLVPNKSTLVEEDVGLPPPTKAFANDDSGRYDYNDKRSMGRASEASSLGGKLIGGYGGQSERSDRRSVRRPARSLSTMALTEVLHSTITSSNKTRFAASMSTRWRRSSNASLRSKATCKTLVRNRKLNPAIFHAYANSRIALALVSRCATRIRL